ncbi:MAG TPA: outer membrane beta-barrel protein [Steroidobacteraceae bacterium]|nr:outer membrane beta-barrel protein [Steroidobacteraceae bacterium]
MRKVIGLCAAIVLAGAGTTALAQSSGYYDYGAPRALQWHIDGGYAATTGRTADYLSGGATIGGGFTLRPDPRSPFYLRADLNYSRFGATRELISIGEQANQTQIDDGTGDIVSLSLDGVLELPIGPRARAYFMGGVGGAYRRIDLTQTVGFGGYFCDAWYGYCGFGVVAGDILVQRTETTRFAWNAGAGLEFPMYGGRSWFIEARYDRMNTDVPTEFVPIRIGMRF